MASEITQTTNSLFDWEGMPELAFISLVKSEEFNRTSTSSSPMKAGQKVRDNSVEVYQTMFSKFLGHLDSMSTSLMATEPRHIGAFVEGALRNTTRETAWRYIRLLERVFLHLVANELLQRNPVTDWVHMKIDSGESPKVGRTQAPPDFIDEATVWRLQDWLYSKGRAEIASGNWRVARDLTLCSISLGSGLRCAELLLLTRERVKHFPGSSAQDRFEFSIPKSCTVPTSREHSSYASEASVDLMEMWWSRRWTGFSRNGIAAAGVALPAGDLVFPATLSGKELDSTTVYRNLKNLSKEAMSCGILTDETKWVLCRGAQGLRRAFALTEIKAGSSDHLLQYRLGLWNQRSVRRYKEQLKLENGQGQIDFIMRQAQ
ncbi:hypothetical protein [Paucibacter soli]|uniref:hypothetical protein n=1 Tax=Paucibacter soli TaxID=3133433 RepID=UPI0030AD347A